MALGKIKADTLEHSTAGSLDTQYVVNGSAKAWVFSTDNVITDSLNTSSSTDVEAGKYTFTYTSTMANTTFSMSSSVNENTNLITGNTDRATSSYQMRLKNTSGTGTDGNSGSLINGDLA